MISSPVTVSKLHYLNALSDLTSVFLMKSMHVIEMEITEEDIDRLYEKYPDHAVRSIRNATDKATVWQTLVLRFAENELVLVRGDGYNECEILAPTRERADQIMQELRAKLGTTEKKVKPSFAMLRNDSGDICCEREENLPEPVADDFLQHCYGEDILDWIDSFKQRTLARPGGFTLLDGPPGTGKTSLVTQMILRLSATHVFYVLPVAQASAFAAADFLPFWQRENTRRAGLVKVVILEDADKLLLRNSDDSSILPAMLNVADGLAGRMLRLHVICSINCPLEQLDPAILRPGRLMNHRRFDLLGVEAARRVAQHLKINWQPNSHSESYSLAQIFNPPVIQEMKPKRILGFAA